MPPLYTLSFQRSMLENAYLCVDDDDLLFMSQSLDQMILRAQRVRKANFGSRFAPEGRISRAPP